MNALIILALLGYGFTYWNYFFGNNESTSPVFETVTILILWPVFHGWAIVFIVWSSFWLLVNIVAHAKKS